MADNIPSEKPQVLAVKKLVKDLSELQTKQRQEREQRSAARYVVEVPITISIINEDGTGSAPEAAWTIDISTGGIGMLSSRGLAPTQRIEVSFSSVDPHLQRIPTEIVHSRKVLESTYKSGGRFIFDEEKMVLANAG